MSVKDSNEITVKINGELDEVYKLLEARGAKIIDKFSMDDTYFIINDLNIDCLSVRQILSKSILVRDIFDEFTNKKTKLITYKIKKFDNLGNILNQDSVNCDILNIEDAKRLLKAIGYKEIMNIKENDIVYEIHGIPLAIKDVINGDNLIEIETENRDGFRNIDELKETILKLNLPIETNDYFVKKAEIELNKRLKRI